ncbi:MAG TPA: hypothetical protein VM347_14485 [Nonomuraea sp.]|nr:hypothetical protein [Nonomuraea sp.]
MTDHTEKAHPKLSAKYPGGVRRGVAEQFGDGDGDSDGDDVGAGVRMRSVANEWHGREA